MKSHNLAQKLKLPTNTDAGVRRPTPEQTLAMYGYATYSYKEGAFIYRVEGVIADLWKTGCTIQGTTPQLVGSRMRVILSLNDQHPPICLNGATVSWFTGDCFGLKFPPLKPDVVMRLEEHMTAT